MTIGEQIIAWGAWAVIVFLGIGIIALCMCVFFEPKWVDVVGKSFLSVEMLTVTITMIIWLWYRIS